MKKYLKNCRNQIEKSANLHTEFWSQLKEDKPDLGKLSEIGYQIHIVNTLVDESWNRLMRINSFIPSLTPSLIPVVISFCPLIHASTRYKIRGFTELNDRFMKVFTSLWII